MNLLTVAGILIGYLIGSISFPQIIAKQFKGIDLREVGSKNVGGRNTIYSVGLFWGIFGGALDVLKGVGSLAAAQAIGLDFPDFLWAGSGAVAGHNWPLWLGFKGGKGISVVLGLAIWFVFPLTLISFLIGLAVLALTRNMIITSAVGFFTLLALIRIQGFDNEIFLLILGCVIIMMIAIVPNIINQARKPEGIKGYFQDPNKDYRNDA